jgi:phosphopentomutase
VLDHLMDRGIPAIGVGKIDDLFAGRGLTEKIHTENNTDGMRKTFSAFESCEKGLVFTNLVDFDMIWGHRNDPAGFARGLEEFDRWLPGLLDRMTDADGLFVVADHGIDPTTPSTDHSRELVPLLVYGPGLKKSVNLGLRQTYADLAATLCDIFGLPPAAREQTGGASFWGDISG